jgi:hypothetical protein
MFSRGAIFKEKILFIRGWLSPRMWNPWIQRASCPFPTQDLSKSYSAFPKTMSPLATQLMALE